MYYSPVHTQQNSWKPSIILYNYPTCVYYLQKISIMSSAITNKMSLVLWQKSVIFSVCFSIFGLAILSSYSGHILVYFQTKVCIDLWLITAIHIQTCVAYWWSKLSSILDKIRECDQAKWVWTWKKSKLIFHFHCMSPFQSYIMLITPSKLYIRFQRYSYFSNVQNRKLNAIIGF